MNPFRHLEALPRLGIGAILLVAALPSTGLLCAAVAFATLGAAAAHADEIVYRDPETCEEKTIRVAEITAEMWDVVRYREKARGPEQSVPSSMVLAVRREEGSALARDLQTAISELERGNVSEARRQLKVLGGGGAKQDLESGRMVYQSFAANDASGRKKRPPWTSEYAQFNYAKALYLEGKAKQDAALLQQAYMALVDQKIPDDQRMKDDKGKPTGPATTGGFLDRFAGGNSRFYPEAMLLAAETLVGLKRWPEAEKAYKALGDQSIAVDLGPRWAYESKLGPGRIAEARGNYLKADQTYQDAANFMRILLRKETRSCYRREIGLLYSRALSQAARVQLAQAEKSKSGPAFAALKKFIEENTPEGIERRFPTMPPAQKQALIEGARDPEAQAIAQNGLGMAAFHQGQFEEAILAFRRVAVKFFQVPEQHARALYYLAQAADKAAGQATGEAKTLYESYRDDARKSLREEHPNSRWKL